MSTTKIPARIVVYCDVCSVECDNKNRRQHGKLHVQRAGLLMTAPEEFAWRLFCYAAIAGRGK